MGIALEGSVNGVTALARSFIDGTLNSARKAISVHTLKPEQLKPADVKASLKGAKKLPATRGENLPEPATYRKVNLPGERTEWVKDVAQTSSKLIVQFGKGANQVSHAFRHTDALGLNRSLVQSSVQTYFKTVSSQVVLGKPFNQIIEIGGQRIQYTAFKLSNGTFNIGRIQESNRKPTPQEENLLAILIKKSSVILPTGWMEGLLVRSMNDDGMGSLYLFPKGEIKEVDRKFGESISEFQFTDQDGIEVIASLYLNDSGNLFELDIWKTDFSKIIRLPEI